MNESRSPARGDQVWHRTGADSELMRLASCQCDGTATEADSRRLDELLADPEALSGYLAVMDQHATFLWRQRWRRGTGLPPFTDGARAVQVAPAGNGDRREQPATRGRSAAMVALDGICAIARWFARPATASFLIAGLFLASVLGLVAFTSLDGGRADPNGGFRHRLRGRAAGGRHDRTGWRPRRAVVCFGGEGGSRRPGSFRGHGP